MEGALTGLSHTSPIGSQLRIEPVQRSGWRSLAAVVLGAYSRAVVGWAMAERISRDLVSLL